MQGNSVSEFIIATIQGVFVERGEIAPPLTAGTPISDCGLDSLDIAALVSRLEQNYSYDPFADGSLTSFPQTINDLAAMYAGRAESAL